MNKKPGVLGSLSGAYFVLPCARDIHSIHHNYTMKLHLWDHFPSCFVQAPVQQTAWWSFCRPRQLREFRYVGARSNNIVYRLSTLPRNAKADAVTLWTFR